MCVSAYLPVSLRREGRAINVVCPLLLGPLLLSVVCPLLWCWLQPVALARSVGFSAKELGEIARIVRAEQTRLQEAWNGYFGG